MTAYSAGKPFYVDFLRRLAQNTAVESLCRYFAQVESLGAQEMRPTPLGAERRSSQFLSFFGNGCALITRIDVAFETHDSLSIASASLKLTRSIHEPSAIIAASTGDVKNPTSSSTAGILA